MESNHAHSVNSGELDRPASLERFVKQLVHAGLEYRLVTRYFTRLSLGLAVSTVGHLLGDNEYVLPHGCTIYCLLPLTLHVKHLLCSSMNEQPKSNDQHDEIKALREKVQQLQEEIERLKKENE